MKSTAVCVVRPAKAEFGVLSKGIRVLARATRWLFARRFQGGEREADLKRDLMVRSGLLARHYSGCRADAQSAARGWRERLREERQRLRDRLSQLEARRERDFRQPATRRRNAVATRKAETRLARVEKEMEGLPRHCFGGRELLRKGHLAAWRRRRDGNALFAGESGKKFGNEVARWDGGRLELKLPAGLGALVLDDVRFDAKVERELQRCIASRMPVSWRVKLLAKGKVKLCVTFGEAEPLIVSEQEDGAVGVDVNADHLAVAHVSGDGRLVGAGREELGADRHGVQVAVQSICDRAAARGVPVVAENLDFRKKKAWLRQYGKRFGSILSNFRSRQVMVALERQCRRRGVELILVDPAWTTRIPRECRYPDRYRIGLHQAAAFVIARRGLGFAERVRNPASPLVRTDVDRRGTRGWRSVLLQWLPGAWRRGGRRRIENRPGAPPVGSVGTANAGPA